MKPVRCLYFNFLFLLLLGDYSFAQQDGCSNYGDPIINITFGNTIAPVYSLDPDVIPGYSFNPNNANRPGMYTIARNGAEAGSIYIPWIGDRQGDPGGRALFVNANDEPGIFYTEIQPGLCPNTNFTFSAWVINASAPNLGCGFVHPINVRFEIYSLDGVLLAMVETGEIQSSYNPEWVNLQVVFNMGDYTDVRLVIRNVGPGGCGNNLAIDDIQFRPCGPDMILSPSITPIQDMIFLCEGETEVTFNSAIGDGFSNPVFQWQVSSNGEGWVDIAEEITDNLTVQLPPHNTYYRLTAAGSPENLTNERCRIVSNAFRVLRSEVPLIAYERRAEVFTCIGVNTVLSADPYEDPYLGANLDNYRWYRINANGRVLITQEAGPTYMPPVAQLGSYTFQRWVVNVCGEEFPDNEFGLTVLPVISTAFNLSWSMLCQDDEPVVLTGGSPELFGSGEAGVYSGPGVINGVFDPGLAGPGNHVLIYTPPPGVRCADPVSVTVTVKEATFVSVSGEPVILPGQNVRLNIQSNGVSFRWDASVSLNRLDVRDPIAAPLETTTYRVMAQNEADCVAYGFVTVKVLEELKITKAFTPNGDGINDRWVIGGIADYPNIELRVYNRYGVTVYSSIGGYDNDNGWDGTYNNEPLPAGTYYYIIATSILPGKLSGSVAILR